MNDYSDLFFLIGAMVIYSLLSVNTNSMFLTSNEQMVQSDIEYSAIALAQDEIDELRWLTKDEENELKQGTTEYRYSDPITRTLEINDQTIDFTMTGTSVPISITGLTINTYLVTLTVSSGYLADGQDIYLTTIKSFE